MIMIMKTSYRDKKILATHFDTQLHIYFLLILCERTCVQDLVASSCQVADYGPLNILPLTLSLPRE